MERDGTAGAAPRADLGESLRPGSLLSGLVLGYEVVLDRAGVREMVLELLEELARGRSRPVRRLPRSGPGGTAPESPKKRSSFNP